MSSLLSNTKSTGKAAKKTTARSAKKPRALPKEPWKTATETPILGYQFSVEMDGRVVAFFQSISGLSVQRNVEKQPEGGRNDFVLELPGPLSFGHISLQAGLTTSKAFWDWMMEGRYDGRVSRKDIFVTQRNINPSDFHPAFQEVKRWSFHQAFPVSWKITDLSVKSTQEIVIETLELSFQYFDLQI